MTAPVYWMKKWCPRCGDEFMKGSRATHCEPCRKLLKAERHRARRDARRKRRGLKPGWRVRRLKSKRRKPNPKVLPVLMDGVWLSPRGFRRYTMRQCKDCPKQFFGGKNAQRCIDCNDAHRRKYMRDRDAKRSLVASRNGKRRQLAATNSAAATHTTAPNTDAAQVEARGVGKNANRVARTPRRPVPRNPHDEAWSVQMSERLRHSVPLVWGVSPLQVQPSAVRFAHRAERNEPASSVARGQRVPAVLRVPHPVVAQTPAGSGGVHRRKART